MEKKKWLYFPMESKAREFESRVLLAVFALHYGYNIVLSQHNVMQKYNKFFPIGIYFFKDLLFYKNKFFEELKRNKFKIVTLDEEGLSSAFDPIFYAKTRCSEKNLDIVEKVICWGEFDYQVVSQTYNKHKGKLFKLGNPRLDVWSPKFDKFFENEVNRLKKRFGNFVFIPSNFGTRANANGPDFTLKQSVENNFFSSENELNEFVESRNYRDRGCGYFLALIPTLAKRFPEVNFVVRNHPSEDPKIWKDVAAGFDNVYVEFKGSISPYIKAANCIVHFGCTSGVEAYLAGVPSFVFCPELNYKFERIISVNLSRMKRNEEDLIAGIRASMKNVLEKDLKAKEFFNANFFYNKEKTSAQRIVEEFGTIEVSDENGQGDLEYIRNDLGRAITLSNRLNRPLLRPLKSLLRMIGRSVRIIDPMAPSPVKKKQKWPGIKREEIEDMINEYQDILNFKEKYTCESICDVIFILRAYES